MEYVTEQIRMYHRLYLSFLSGTLVCLGISGILFIRMNIWSVIGYFTGRQKKYGKQELSFRTERKVILVHTNERI